MRKIDKIKTFSVYKKETGEILKRVICSESDMCLQFDVDAESIVEGFYDDKKQKVKNEKVVDKEKEEHPNG